MTSLSPPALYTPTDEAFVAQCESDYTIAEITALAHVDPDTNNLTHLLSVVELIHQHLEENPLIGLPPPHGYPRRTNIGRRGGSLLVQRWHLPVRDGIEWYKTCSTGSNFFLGTQTPIPLGALGSDPLWPHLVAEVESFWPDAEFWGDRPGGSRWHRLLPLAPVEITENWERIDFEKARSFLMAEIHMDLLSRSVMLGSCHLRLPNPVYRDLHQHVDDDWRSINFEVVPYSDQPVQGLELTFWNRRAWGATQVRRMALQAGSNLLTVPEGVEQVAHAVHSESRGLLEQSEVAGFITAVNAQINLVTEQRRVLDQAASAGASPSAYTVGIVGHAEEIQVGTPRPVGALCRLAADEDQRNTRKAWSQVSFRWFDRDSLGGAQAVRDIIGNATKRIDLIDPYFGRGDLLRFALATTRHALPLRILTSAFFCSSWFDQELKIEHGDALVHSLDNVQEQDPRLNIEIKVMAGKKPPVHDRFLIVDEAVWVLGASLNEFGSPIGNFSRSV